MVCVLKVFRARDKHFSAVLGEGWMKGSALVGHKQFQSLQWEQILQYCSLIYFLKETFSMYINVCVFGVSQNGNFGQRLCRILGYREGTMWYFQKWLRSTQNNTLAFMEKNYFKGDSLLKSAVVESCT